MKRGKLAQVSVFVIIGIIIAAGALSVFYVKYNNRNSASSSEEKQVQDFLFECFSSAYKSSLDNVGIQGGYFREPLSEYLDTGYYRIPFYSFGGITYIPSNGIMEEELSYSVNSGIFQCLGEIDKYNLDYDYNYKSTKVTINEKSVDFVADLELSLTKGEKTTEIDFKEHPISIGSNLMEMNYFSSYITYSYDLNKGSICLNCFMEIAGDKGFDVEIYNDMENILMVNIIDNSTENNPGNYVFLLTDLIEVNEPVVFGSQDNNPINMSEGNLNVVAPKI